MTRAISSSSPCLPDGESNTSWSACPTGHNTITTVLRSAWARLWTPNSSRNYADDSRSKLEYDSVLQKVSPLDQHDADCAPDAVESSEVPGATQGRRGRGPESGRKEGWHIFPRMTRPTRARMTLSGVHLWSRLSSATPG